MSGPGLWYLTPPSSQSLSPNPHTPASTVRLGRLKGFHFRLAAGTTSSRLRRNWNNHSQNTHRCSHTPGRARNPGPWGAREPTPRAPSPASRQSILSSCHRNSLLLLLPQPPSLLLCLLSPLVLLPRVPAPPPGDSCLAAKGRTISSGSPSLSRQEEAGTGLCAGRFVAGCWSASGLRSC